MKDLPSEIKNLLGILTFDRRPQYLIESDLILLDRHEIISLPEYLYKLN